jgi:hypothetical protein
MHILLEKLFKKRGIEKVEDLSSEEKAQFDSWHRVLTNEPVTIPKLKEFLASQKSLIEAEFGEISNSSQKNDRLVLQHAIYSKLLRVIDADKLERESLEKYLTNLIDNTTA